MRSRLANRSALKFQKFNRQKAQINLSKKALSFKVHSVVQSTAQILIPPNYQFSKLQDLIAMVTCGDIVFWAQITESSFTDKNLEEISILQNLALLAGLTIEGGFLKGQIQYVEKQKIPKQYHLEFAEVLVKNMYFSRRDQYKVIKYLQDRQLHVYNRKIVYFHQLKLDFNNFITKKGKIAKSGIIDKSTKLIFRTSCSKYTILIEIAEEMFELNEDKQLYLEKAIKFLTLFFLRNTFFQISHRIQIILFARVFYPFKTLKQAYLHLNGQQDDKKCVFATNFASALQKDYHGRIYQDFYRRILCSDNGISGFRQKFSYKVSQFLFTMNVEPSQSYSKYLKQSVGETIFHFMSTDNMNDQSLTLKPFVHRLSGKLSKAEDACFFQAISLISEQFKHHYIFRSLEETGNAIMLVSAGKFVYKTDYTTYKMAKSNVNLTNIHTVAVNLRRKEHNISVELVNLKKKPLFNQKDTQKLKKLIDWCKQQKAYKTPTNFQIQFPQQKFQLKSLIYANKLTYIPKNKIESILSHDCLKQQHTINNEQQQYIAYQTKIKSIEWIKTFYMDDKAFMVHNILYSHLNFNWHTFNIKKIKDEDPQLGPFQRDLKLIINKKKQYNFRDICQESLNQSYLDAYTSELMKIKKIGNQKIRTNNQGNMQNLLDYTQEKYVSKFFEISSSCYMFQLDFADPNRKLSKEEILLNFNESAVESPNSPRSYQAQMFRRSFDEERQHTATPGQVPNIFEQTYRKGEYWRLNHMKDVAFLQVPKNLSHNKQRLKKNYPHSPIHFMMSYFQQQTISKLNQFINAGKDGKYWKVDQTAIDSWFLLERQWKQLIFPILTPLYTSFKKKQENDSFQKRDAKYTKSGKYAVEDQICKYLMENFQIQDKSSTNINLSKGHVNVSLYISSTDNVMTFETIDTKRQDRIIPKMLYRYLSFEQKDSRFSSRSITFSDANYYLRQVSQPKKSVKLMLVQRPNIESDLNCIRDFAKYLKQRYPQIKLEVNTNSNPSQSNKEIVSDVYKVSMNLVQQNTKHPIYRSEIIQLIIDLQFHPLNLFNFTIQWDYCCAVYLNQFISNIVSIAWKSKLVTHKVSTDHAFNAQWHISAIGQILFDSPTGMQFLENSINKGKMWLWDHQGYYMDREAHAFIRFIRNKNLIQWKDNNIDKSKWKKYQDKEKFLEFFAFSIGHDILGSIIDSIFH